jgi:RNA polymerase sigma factor (sigma-70 family)
VIAATAHRGPPPPPGEDPELQLQHLKHSLSTLNKAERALLIMRYDTGLPFIDIAHILGISVASVRRRLARALQHLREVMPHDA